MLILCISPHVEAVAITSSTLGVLLMLCRRASGCSRVTITPADSKADLRKMTNISACCCCFAKAFECVSEAARP